MQRKHVLAVMLGMVAVIGFVEVAQAKIRIFGFAGNRGQVTSACSGSGRTLTEGVDQDGVGWSWCFDAGRQTSVVCDDNGSCLGQTPRVANSVVAGKPVAPKFPVYESLSDSNDSPAGGTSSGSSGPGSNGGGVPVPIDPMPGSPHTP